MKLIDAFMGFLVVVGGLQFVYCVLVGNYVGFWHFSYSTYYPSYVRVSTGLLGGGRITKTEEVPCHGSR